MIELEFNEFIKERNKVLTVKIPFNEVEFHKLSEGMRLKAKLSIFEERDTKPLDDGKNQNLTTF